MFCFQSDALWAGATVSRGEFKRYLRERGSVRERISLVSRVCQGAIKGGRQNKFDHFLLLLVTFWSAPVTFLPDSFSWTPDGPAIRNANRGDSHESIRRQKTIFITCERFARITSNLRFTIFKGPELRFAKKGGSVEELLGDSRESSDSGESANRFT